jgi:hypothetical protein
LKSAIFLKNLSAVIVHSLLAVISHELGRCTPVSLTATQRNRFVIRMMADVS